jgi:hypothetical protein
MSPKSEKMPEFRDYIENALARTERRTVKIKATALEKQGKASQRQEAERRRFRHKPGTTPAPHASSPRQWDARELIGLRSLGVAGHRQTCSRSKPKGDKNEFTDTPQENGDQSPNPSWVYILMTSFPIT